MDRSMAKKKTTTKKKTTASRSKTYKVPNAAGKHLVIVESPTKAKTINKYLGKDYIVMASVGHVRDLPARAPKGVKQEVPGVDVDNDFAPTYEIMPRKKQTVADLKKAAKAATDVWFATDLDREGEAIAWHLAQSLGVPVNKAKRVVFNAITKTEIQHAFDNPHPIDENKVNAQQARRILDRIVGYQVSPLLWKKVAGGLSAGRVQSVAVRLVVEREREIDAFIPDEYWRIGGYFCTDLKSTSRFADAWRKLIDETEDLTQKEKLRWLSENKCINAELVQYDGDAFKPTDRKQALAAAEKIGFVLDHADETEDPKGKGTANHRVTYVGHIEPDTDFTISSIETKRTSSRPPAPFITSSLQQAAANRLGFPLQKTMRIAQQLYEGIDIHGMEGQTGLITYMRTDSTHLSGEALEMARNYIAKEWGDKYLPEKPNFYATKNKSAQEAHEAIRVTDIHISPKRVQKDLTAEQYKLYRLIWERFVAGQCVPAQWDSTSVMIDADKAPATFKATGRTLVFEGFYRAAGLPANSDVAVLPQLSEKQKLVSLQIDPTQHFTAPPPRFTEASLQKKLEDEGIGRPSTYAAIIQTIQDRKYVEPFLPRDKRMRATDLGMVVTDKLVECFPKVLDVAYTRYMEGELDKVEEEHHDWVTMLRDFYGPFKKNLDRAHEEMVHAKAETQPAPYKCEDCGDPTMYRFGKNGRFLSCTRYPDCKYAAPIDREGKPVGELYTDLICPVDGSRLIKRVGRFGPFLSSENYPEVKFILNIDAKKDTVKLPKPPPLAIDIPCAKCEEGKMNMRRSKRGPWLSCNRFPKCRGRVAWSSLEEAQQAELEKALAKHEKANPVPKIYNVNGEQIGEDYLPQILEEESAPDSNAA